MVQPFHALAEQLQGVYRKQHHQQRAGRGQPDRPGNGQEGRAQPFGERLAIHRHADRRGTQNERQQPIQGIQPANGREKEIQHAGILPNPPDPPSMVNPAKRYLARASDGKRDEKVTRKKSRQGRKSKLLVTIVTRVTDKYNNTHNPHIGADAFMHMHMLRKDHEKRRHWRHSRHWATERPGA